MENYTCPASCTVQFLSELLVCTQQNCPNPIIRCKDCFGKIHRYTDELGKLRTHSNQKFDESQLFKNFLYVNKLYQIVSNKFKKAYGKVNQNVENNVWQIFCTSQFVKGFSSQQALTQFYVLKQIFNNRKSQFTASPSSDLDSSLALFTQKIFKNAKTKLLQPTQQQILMSYYFNQASDCNTIALQAFIANQQQRFTQFCDQTREKKQNFDILNYISNRKQAQDFNKVYFSRVFQNFLQQKYSQKPEQQQLFTTPEYINYTWQNLPIICSNPQIEAYLNQWLQNFRTYNQYMKSQQLIPTLLAFRMWKSHVPNPTTTILHQDKYFLDTFIFAFIDNLITAQNYSVGVNVATLNWKNFMKYLKDYVAASKLKQEQFVDLSKYSDYYDFRIKNQNFVEFMQKSQDISFNKNHCIEFLNQSYKDNSKIVKKNYIKFITTKQQQQLQKQHKLQQQSQNLHKQLSQLEGQKFYIIIFNDYLRDCLKDQTPLSQQGYFSYKKQVLQRYSEQQIKLSNDQLLLAQKQALQAQLNFNKQKQQSQNKQGEGEIKKQEGKIIYEVSQTQQQLVNLDSDKEEDQEIIACPCCQGKPQDCQKEQCQMMGFCVTCSL